MKPQFFTVYDKGRQLDFEGFHLATANSFMPSKTRWFVVDIYKTVGGKYIVAGSGKSNVVHRNNCPQMKEKNAKAAEAIKTSVPCEKCRPVLSELVYHEVNREWAQVSEDPAAIIERLRLRDSDGVWYLPKTSSNALLHAAEFDEGIKRAFYAPQRID
jgi:hypothetical protein